MCGRLLVWHQSYPQIEVLGTVIGLRVGINPQLYGEMMVLKYCFITSLKTAIFVSIVHFKVMFYFEDDSISSAMILCIVVNHCRK